MKNRNLLPKQETLEEYQEALKQFPEYDQYLERIGFESGAKWQQERSYSEEEAKQLAFDFYHDMSRKMNVPENLITENMTNLDVWFEQYEKK